MEQANLTAGDFAVLLGVSRRRVQAVLQGDAAPVAEHDRLTHEDVNAARRELTRVHARLRAEGEEPVIAAIWDTVVDEVVELPEVREALTIVDTHNRAPHLPVNAADADKAEAEEEAVHQAVVKLVQDAQRTADELRASGDRAQRPA